MNFLNHKWLRYLVLIPILYLLVSAVMYSNMTRNIDTALLQQKYDEIATDIDILATSLNHYIDVNDDWNGYDYSRNVGEVVNFIDNLPHVFAAAYRISPDGGLEVFSDRYADEVVGFDPLLFDEFVRTVASQESGDLQLQYAPEAGRERTMLLRFRWIPTNPALDGRFLVVAAVSEYSITVPMAAEVTKTQIINIIVTFLLNAALVAVLVCVGEGKKKKVQRLEVK